MKRQHLFHEGSEITRACSLHNAEVLSSYTMRPSGYCAVQQHDRSSNVALGSAAGFNATTGANNMYIGYGVAGIAVKATSVTSQASLAKQLTLTLI